MLDLDVWGEVLDTMRRNKLRTLLTGFSVAWGIFMLIVLLGSGQGLAQGVEWQFRDDAINSIRVRGDLTSLPHQGFPPGRGIQLEGRDLGLLQERVAGVQKSSGRFWARGLMTVSYQGKTSTFRVMGVHPDHLYIERTLVKSGRFLNDIDVREARKVAAIGTKVKSELFQDQDPIGRWIAISGIAFQVVGVFHDAGGEGELERIYIPVTSAQKTFNGQDRLDQLLFLVDVADVPASERMIESMRALLSIRHDFAPADLRALSVYNNVEQFARISGVISGIRMFVWIIGFGTILAGVVGVSNIMLITVRERTKEIGVRKALGATPASIVALVLQESILITSVAGFVGLVAGISLVEVVGANLPASEFFRNPSVDLGVALRATLLLIGAGALAGFIPARRAAAIRPIEALRDE